MNTDVAPVTGTEIDEQTQDELQPPCEVGHCAAWTGRRCTRAAEWICHLMCPTCGPRAALDCTLHMAQLAAGKRFTCNRCYGGPRDHAAVSLVRVEPLR